MDDRIRKMLTPELLSSLQGLELIARVVVEGFMSGSNRSRTVGAGQEFSQYRNYEPGDDLRHHAVDGGGDAGIRGASLRGERDLAVGNVVGSSIFNVLSVLGVGAAVSGGLEVAPGLLHFDLPVMLAVSLICLPVFMTGPAITRLEGGILVLYYIAYTAYLGLHATDHHLREEFGTVVLGVVVPFTLVVATAFWWRGRDRTGAAPTE